MTLGLVYELGFYDFSDKTEEKWSDL